MTKQKVNFREAQSGNIMLITTIVILVLTVIIATCMNISGMQLDLSMLERNTSNTYYLAKSGVEKQVDTINKSLDIELSHMVEEIAKTYIPQLAAPSNDADKLEAMESKASCSKYDNFYYASDQLRITNSNLVGELQEKVYEFVKDNYIGKTLDYEVQSDHADMTNYTTKVTVKAEAIKTGAPATTDQTGFKLIATAQTKNTTTNEVYDIQTVEAHIGLMIPDELPNQIHEKYTWAANPPEILNSALISFSDVVVTSGGTLDINDGDMQVKGGKGQEEYQFDATDKTVIINDGTFSDNTQTGGVIVSNGGKLNVENGDIACINNVVATNGWSLDVNDTSNYGLTTQIFVTGGDIIANTVGLVDDYYAGGINQSPFNANKQGTNLGINVIQNIFVSNDVMISRWIKDAGINVEGTIFGVNNGSDIGNESANPIYSTGTNAFIDPNSSSGVFSQGVNTTISAYRILVNGQPYITLEKNKLPMKLWESVGEPFDGVALWEGYRNNDESNANNKTYLDTDSPFNTLIARNKIKISDGIVNPSSLSYGPGKISANNITTTGTGMRNDVAAELFMKGLVGTTTGADYEINHYTSEGNYSSKDYIVQQNKDAVYYKNTHSNYSWYNKSLMYGKTYTTTTAGLVSNYMGLRAYMTAKRSVFYGKMNDKNSPQLLSFNEVISNLPTTAQTWSYSNPIVVTSGNVTINVSSFYVAEDGANYKAYPSIIINQGIGAGTITLKASDATMNEFNGVIITEGDVKVVGTIKINGTVIIKGIHESANPAGRESRMTGGSEVSYSPGLVISSGGHLTINHDANMLLNINTNDDTLYRQILDALKITQYSTKSTVKEILGPYSNGNLTYSAGKVFYTTASTLEVETQGIKAQIKSLKKMR